MADDQTVSRTTLTGPVVTSLLALLAVAIHLATNGRYGFHQDEFYFIACGYHPALGYVDQPPMVPMIARLSMFLFGDSLRGLRFFPAIAHGVTILLTGLLTRRMGGGRFAQGLAALAVLVAPMWLRASNMLTIPAFEPLFWVLCAYLLVRIIQEDNPKLWLWIGVVAGIGLMNKDTMLFFGFGLVVAMVLTPLRKYFKSPWLYAGGAIAFLIVLPNIIWQMQNGWPTLIFLKGLNEGTMSQISVPEFIVGQVLYLLPFNAPLWLGGLLFLLFTRKGRPYRVFAFIYLAVAILLIVAKSKIYYLAPAYPMLFAGGAWGFEGFLNRKQLTWPRPATVAVLVIGGLIFAPLALPIFPIMTTDRYISAVSGGVIKNAYELTGDLHAEFGWPNLVKTVNEVYQNLPEDEKKKCVIWGRGYGEAGAVDYYGKQYGLPHAISTDMTYYLWGLPTDPTTTFITVAWPEKLLNRVFNDVKIAAVAKNKYTNPWRQKVPIAICRNPKKPLEEIWPRFRDWSD